MVDVTIYVDEKEIKRRLGNLAYKSGSVISRAANRAAKTGKVTISRDVSKKYLLTQKEINSEGIFHLKNANSNEPTARLTYRDKHRNLYLWKNVVTPRTIIHWTAGPKPNVKNYKARVMRGHSKIPMTGPNAPFIQKTHNHDFVGLFRRKTEDRDSKLIGVSASSLPQIIRNEETMALFHTNSEKMFEKRVIHEIERVLEGH